MTTPSPYAVLFEPVRIGPVTARNRFYQVPHCTGMGHALPRTLAAMRAMKAEGGWGVVCTEYCSIHPSSDDQPHPYASLWDEDDVRANALMTDAVHAHGALAGVELWHGGSITGNLSSRVPAVGVRSMPSWTEPVQSRPMDRRDIAELRRWHREAALRALQAGFDIVYVYPTHGYLVAEFLSRSLNGRTDEYGGPLSNRMRLMRELIEETLETVGHKCAVAVRFSADGHGDEHLPRDEALEVIERLSDLPDLWDLVVADYYNHEMATSRFQPQGALEAAVAAARKLTRKPVVSVGRFTSPDAMVRQVRQGILDLVGAARPSIADPFLPEKVRTGRLEDIRECIGCNICYAHNFRGAALRCTQNPTMGEEWRRGWHPEKVAPAPRRESVLVVGAGPAGLEAAHILGKRGFEVALADAEDEPGGRVRRESRLPGLAEWGRVRDYRIGQIRTMANVALYPGSRLDAAQVREFAADHVLVATGARWRADGLGRHRSLPLALPAGLRALTPDDILEGARPQGACLVYDDDHYYMGPVVALALARAGARVTYVTTESRAGRWSHYTGEQWAVQEQLLRESVEIQVDTLLAAWDGSEATLACPYTGRERRHGADHLVLVTSREPERALYLALAGDGDPPPGLRCIGDCLHPGLIVHAVHSGHLAARELGDGPAPFPPRDRILIVPAPATHPNPEA